MEVVKVGRGNLHIKDIIPTDGVISVDCVNPRCELVQVSFNTDNVTAGVLTVQVKYDPLASWEVLEDVDGNAQSVDLVSTTASKSFQIKDSYVYGLRFTPSALAGNLSILLREDTIAGLVDSY